MKGARRLKARMEGTGRPLAKTEEAQWLQAETEEVGRLHAMTERNRLIQVGTEEVRMLQDRVGRSSAAPGYEEGMSATR